LEDDVSLVRTEAVQAIGELVHFPSHENLAGLATSRLHHQQWQVRYSAARALLIMGAGAAQQQQALVDSLGDPHHMVRQSVLEALEAIWRSSVGKDASALAAMQDACGHLLQDEYEDVRSAGCAAVASMGGDPKDSEEISEQPRDRERPLFKLLADEKPKVRIAAVKALGRIATDRSELTNHLATELAAMLEVDLVAEVRAEAVATLGQLGAKSQVQALVGRLEDEDHTVRAAAAKAIEDIDAFSVANAY